MKSDLLELSYNEENQYIISNTDNTGYALKYFKDDTSEDGENRVVMKTTDIDGNQIFDTVYNGQLFDESGVVLMHGEITNYDIDWKINSNVNNSVLEVDNSTENNEFHTINLHDVFRNDSNAKKSVIKSIVITNNDDPDLTNTALDIKITTIDNFAIDDSGAYKMGLYYYLSDKETKILPWNSEIHKLLDEEEGLYLQKIDGFDYDTGLWQKGSINVDHENHEATLSPIMDPDVFDVMGVAVNTTNEDNDVFIYRIADDLFANASLTLTFGEHANLRTFNTGKLFEGFYTNLLDAQEEQNAINISPAGSSSVYDFVSYDQEIQALFTNAIELSGQNILYMQSLDSDTLGKRYIMNTSAENVQEIGIDSLPIIS